MDNKKIDSEIGQLKQISQAKHKKDNLSLFCLLFIPFIFILIILIDICFAIPQHMHCNKEINRCSIYRGEVILNFPITDIVRAYSISHPITRRRLAERNDLYLELRDKKKNLSVFGFNKNPSLQVFPRYNIALINDEYHIEESAKEINTYLSSNQKELYIKEKLCLRGISTFILFLSITVYIYLGLINFQNLIRFIKRKCSYLKYKITFSFRRHSKSKK